MNELKLGIIGTNFISDWLMAAVNRTEGIRLAAVYSRQQETGDAFAAKYGSPRVYTDRKAFLSSDIDAVYIASPNFCHFEQAKDALLHGKHVLLEKPACLHRAEFQELTELAKEKDLVILEAMRPGHDPELQTIRAAFPKIGTIRRAVFDFCQYSSRYDKFRAGTVLHAFDPSYGNAAIMDIGCYAIHTAVCLFGAPERVDAHCIKLQNGFEGQGLLFLSYPELTVEVVYSKITESYTPSIISGEDGTITIGKLSMMSSAEFIPRNGKPEALFAPRESHENMVFEVQDLIRCIRGELRQEPFWENTLTTLGIMDEALRQNQVEFGVRSCL